MLKRKPRKGEILLYDGRRGRVQAEVLGFAGSSEDIIGIRLPTRDTSIIWRFHDGLNKLLSHTVKCPTEPRKVGDTCGCGAILPDEPDEEGLVDCTECGMWFNPAEEAAREVAANLAVAMAQCAELGHRSTENGCTRCGLGVVP